MELVLTGKISKQTPETSVKLFLLNHFTPLHSGLVEPLFRFTFIKNADKIENIKAETNVFNGCLCFDDKLILKSIHIFLLAVAAIVMHFFNNNIF